MSWTTAAAWFGASGTVLSLAWQVRVERRNRRPDVTITAQWHRGNVDRADGMWPSGRGVLLTVHAASPTTITEAGLSPPKRRRMRSARPHRALVDEGRNHLGIDLPRGAVPGQAMRIWLLVADDDAIDRDAEHVAWVRTSSGHAYRSNKPFTLTPFDPMIFDRDTGNMEGLEEHRRRTGWTANA